MKYSVPSLEFIGVQDDKIFKDITHAVAFIRDSGSLSTDVIWESKLEQIINDRFNTNIALKIVKDDSINAYAGMPLVDKNHPFNVGLNIDELSEVGKFLNNIDKLPMKLGTVDLVAAKLSGIYTKIPATLGICSGTFDSKVLTNENIAAMIIHEVGHVFSYFLYLGHSFLGGFIPVATAAAAAGAKGDAQRKMVLEKGIRVMGIEGVNTYNLLSQSTEDIAAELQAIYINDTKTQLRSLTGYGLYETKSVEQLADTFAVKCGAGLASVELQYKIAKIYNSRSVRSRASLMIQNAIVIPLMVLTTIATAGTFLYNVALFADSKYDTSTYDNDRDRVRYMKQQMVDALKNASLPDEARSQMVKDIEAAEKIIEKVKYNPTMSSIVRKYILSNVRVVQKALDIQKTIEEMLYNDLFVAAAKFRGAANK